jgi:hypothetical protein
MVAIPCNAPWAEARPLSLAALPRSVYKIALRRAQEIWSAFRSVPFPSALGEIKQLPGLPRDRLEVYVSRKTKATAGRDQ